MPLLRLVLSHQLLRTEYHRSLFFCFVVTSEALAERVTPVGFLLLEMLATPVPSPDLAVAPPGKVTTLVLLYMARDLQTVPVDALLCIVAPQRVLAFLKARHHRFLLAARG